MDQRKSLYAEKLQKQYNKSPRPKSTTNSHGSNQQNALSPSGTKIFQNESGRKTMLVQKMREFKLFSNEDQCKKMKQHNFQNSDENLSPSGRRRSSVPGHHRSPSSGDLTQDFLKQYQYYDIRNKCTPSENSSDGGDYQTSIGQINTLQVNSRKIKSKKLLAVQSFSLNQFSLKNNQTVVSDSDESEGEQPEDVLETYEDDLVYVPIPSEIIQKTQSENFREIEPMQNIQNQIFNLLNQQSASHSEIKSEFENTSKLLTSQLFSKRQSHIEIITQEIGENNKKQNETIASILTEEIKSRTCPKNEQAEIRTPDYLLAIQSLEGVKAKQTLENNVFRNEYTLNVPDNTPDISPVKQNINKLISEPNQKQNDKSDEIQIIKTKKTRNRSHKRTQSIVFSEAQTTALQEQYAQLNESGSNEQNQIKFTNDQIQKVEELQLLNQKQQTPHKFENDDLSQISLSNPRTPQTDKDKLVISLKSNSDPQPKRQSGRVFQMDCMKQCLNNNDSSISSIGQQINNLSKENKSMQHAQQVIMKSSMKQVHFVQYVLLNTLNFGLQFWKQQILSKWTQLLINQTLHQFQVASLILGINVYKLQTLSITIWPKSQRLESQSDEGSQNSPDRLMEEKVLFSPRKYKAVVIIDVTLNNKLQQLIISEIHNDLQTGDHTLLDNAEALDRFCKTNDLSQDKRAKLEEIVNEQIKKYYQKVLQKQKSRNSFQLPDQLSQIDEKTVEDY